VIKTFGSPSAARTYPGVRFGGALTFPKVIDSIAVRGISKRQSNPIRTSSVLIRQQNRPQLYGADEAEDPYGAVGADEQHGDIDARCGGTEEEMRRDELDERREEYGVERRH
jgi:hypothetical protein